VDFNASAGGHGPTPFWKLICVGFTCCLFSSSVLATSDVFDQFYRYVETKNKIIEPHLPGEVVDPFTGTLRIVQEDLFLPGRAGLDLRIIRTYSSKVWGRSDAPSVDSLLADKEPTPVGFGWSMHMGRLRNPNATAQPLPCGGGDYPVYEAADGSARVFYPDVGSNVNFTSRDAWKLEKNCPTAAGPGVCIKSTTGETLEFASAAQYFVGTVPVWPQSAIVDVFSNRIDIAYVGNGSGRVERITDTWNRTVDFNYLPCGPTRKCLQSIVASGSGGSRQVTYAYTTYTPAQTGLGVGYYPLPAPGRAFLTAVQPAAGPGYAYAYHYDKTVARNQFALASITYPYGGATTYTYDTRPFFTGRDSVPMAVVVGRQTTGRDLPSASWGYEYVSPTVGDYQTTIITRPDGLTDEYKSFGFGYAASKNATGYVWKVGLQDSVSRGGGAEVEKLEWDKGKAITTANYSAPVYGNTSCPAWTWDTTVQAPVLTKRTITRDGSRYELTASGHDAYGQPTTLSETGEAQRSAASRAVRSRSYAYDYDTASNQVLGRIVSETVCQGGGTADCMRETRTFNGPNRRLDSHTVRGVPTTFTYWPDGNLKTVTNARSQTLTLDGYQAGNGIATQIDFNGAFSVTRSAYWDGSLKSESDGRGNVTGFTYDAAGRLETISPPGTSDLTRYTYSPSGDSYTTTRGTGVGAFSEVHSLDGLGREIALSNNVGEKQTSEFDWRGGLVFKSYPMIAGGAEVGDRRDLDALGRPVVVMQQFMSTGHRPLAGACADPARCKTTISYLAEHCQNASADRAPGDSVTSKRCFESFADPNEERLVKFVDGKSKDWLYAYDVAGNLRTFTAPQPAGSRSATFAPTTFFPKTETSGPRGVLTILSHNPLGQPLSQLDARGLTTTFDYTDPLSRLKLTSYGANHPENVTRVYDRDTLKSVSTPNGGTQTYTYDESKRIRQQTWQIRDGLNNSFGKRLTT